MHIFTKMKNEIIIPDEIEAEISKNKLTLKGKEGENSREFNLGKINLEKKDSSNGISSGGKIILSCEKATKKEKRIINTSIAHIKNMIKGIQKKFEYSLKICSSHFPMTVKIEGENVVVKNFLGEKVDRKIKLPKNVEIKLNGDIIKIISIDKELAGQGAANLERVTKIKKRDRRIFQDGIYIIDKSGKEI